jgi:hypothetical protein
MNEMTAWGERQSLHQQRQQLMIKEQQEKKQQREMERQQRQLQMKVGGGIGSNGQRHVEVIRKRQLQHPNQQQRQQQRQETPVSTTTTTTPARASIYLANLPTDGSITERTLGSLFCTYGRLDRVTMYRDRASGELKGDGLIVFGRDAIAATTAAQNRGDNAAADLVDIVCTQMNGAELPCGTVIGVEPADMDWGKTNGSNKKSKTSSFDHHQSPTVQVVRNCGSDGVEMNKSNEASTEAAAREETTGGNDEEDLDDFFASLE